MHQHLAHPPAPDPAPSLLDNLSDTLLNAFAKVRKPDERFVDMRDSLDRFEEALNGIDRIYNRTRTRLAGACEGPDALACAQTTGHRSLGRL
jgi:sorting nexin-4